jgi:hypothetical protein
MRRTIDQALDDLRSQLANWLRDGGRPGLRLFVYPPEWEAAMLARLPAIAAEFAAKGQSIDVLDVGQGFAGELERRRGLIDRLTALERERPEGLLNDLGVLATNYLKRRLRTLPDPPAVARLVVNTGALGPFASYSALANDLEGAGPETAPAVPTVLAFPGEADDRSLNLLGLRQDTNYRVARM